MTLHWSQYQQQALTTAIYPLSRELDYTILGLCSEVGEIGEAYDNGDALDVLAEIGDNFWYCAAIADALKLPLDYVAVYTTDMPTVPDARDAHIRAIVTEVSQMAGVLKKSIRDNDGYLADAGQTKIVTHLYRTIWLLDALCRVFGSTRTAVMSKNLDKLASRKARGVLTGSGDNR